MVSWVKILPFPSGLDESKAFTVLVSVADGISTTVELVKNSKFGPSEAPLGILGANCPVGKPVGVAVGVAVNTGVTVGEGVRIMGVRVGVTGGEGVGVKVGEGEGVGVGVGGI